MSQLSSQRFKGKKKKNQEVGIVKIDKFIVPKLPVFLSYLRVEFLQNNRQFIDRFIS